MRLYSFFLIIFFAFSLLLPKNSFAQGAVSVTPQIFFIDLSKDEPLAEFIYKNTTSKPIELSFSLRDFKELEEGGIPGFLDKQSERNYKYGLSSWAKLSSQSMVLDAGETKTLQVSVDPKRLGLGGHYSSILAEIIQPDNTKQVKLRAILASLLFVRAGGEFDRVEGKILSFTPDSQVFLPESFSFRFQNSGNVYVTPHGTVKLNDFLGREVASAIVNENSLVSLPESIRTYPIVMSYNTNIFLPGVYKATVKINFGDKDIETQKYFLSFGNIQNIIAAVAIILVLVVLIKNRNKILLKNQGRGNTPHNDVE